jgi:hypothetical protein
MASPKFREPGDFLVYLVFVCATIVVGIPIYPSRFPNIFFTPHIICPHSAILTAIAVPGDEEDYPCTSTGPSFAYQSKDQFAVLAWWEVPLRKLVSIPLLHSGGCDSLHPNTNQFERLDWADESSHDMNISNESNRA